MKVNPPSIKPASVPDVIRRAEKNGLLNVCPQETPSNPDISEPIYDPVRRDQILHWDKKMFAYVYPDGSAFFCDRIQKGDPSRPFNDENVMLDNEKDWLGVSDEA